MSEDEDQITRPTTRGECRDGIRPCPWAACRYHLLLDVGRPKGGRLAPSIQRSGVRALVRKASPEDVDAWTEAAADALLEMPDTCALDVAERGALEEDVRGDPCVANTLETIGGALGITREGARLEVDKAIDRAREQGPELEAFTRDRGVRLVVLADGCRRNPRV